MASGAKPGKTAKSHGVEDLGSQNLKTGPGGAAIGVYCGIWATSTVSAPAVAASPRPEIRKLPSKQNLPETHPGRRLMIVVLGYGLNPKTMPASLFPPDAVVENRLPEGSAVNP